MANMPDVALIRHVRLLVRRVQVVPLFGIWMLLQALITPGSVTGARGGSSNTDIIHRDTPRKEKPFLRIATIQSEPLVRLRWEPGLIANDRYEGMYIDLLNELAQQQGFNYQLYLVPDGKTGLPGEDGRWNGLIGELEKEAADLALAPIIVTEERADVVSFTSPLSPVRISVLSRQPGTAHDTGFGSTQRPYGIVSNSETSYAIRSNEQLFDSLRQNYGVIYVNSLMEGLDRAREGDLDLIMSSQLADYYSDQEPCDLVAREFHGVQDLAYSLAVVKDSEMLTEINAALGRLTMGTMLHERLEQKWLRGSCRRSGTLPTSMDTTTNTDSAEDRRQIVITSVVVEPYLMRSSKRGVEFEGYIADLIRQMALVVPFDYTWRVQRRFGRRKKDGSWTGMIGDLIERKADMAAAPFLVDDSKTDRLSFSRPFLESTLSIVVKSSPSGDFPVLMVEDLLNQTTVDFGVVHKSRVAKQLKNSDLPIYKKLWKKIRPKNRENRILSIEDGLERVRGGNYALLMESTDATYISSKRPCDLISLSQYLAMAHYAFATQKDSELLSYLNNALLKLQERGILQALFHKWWNTDECLDHEQAEDTTPLETQAPVLTTPEPVAPHFDIDIELDLDKLLGLSTEPYKIPENESDIYDSDDNHDRDVMDMERIFLTSPVSAFTPKRASTSPPMPHSPSKIVPSESIDVARPVATEPTVRKNTTEQTHIMIRNETQDTELDTMTSHTTERTTTETATETTTTRRRGRTRRPGRRKGRKRKKKTTPPPTAPTPQITTENHTPFDFDMDIDWFFATEQPRPEDYDDYDKFNYSDNNKFTSRTVPENITFQMTKSVSRTTSTQTQPTVVSSAPSSGGSGRAVLFVVFIHLLIFGWPPSPHDCIENCRS